MPGGNLYTQSEDDAILRIHNAWQGAKGWRIEAARVIGRSPNSVTNRYLELNARQAREQSAPMISTLSRSVRDVNGVRILAPLETELEPEEQFLSRVRKATAASVARHKAEKYVRVRIESDRPIAFSISSDWHLSSTSATDVDGLITYAEAIRDTPGAYAVAVGDQTDNPIKHKPTATREIPDDLRLLDIVLGRFGTKLLGMTSGNHDDWTKAMVGVDNLQTMAERHRLHYAPDELIWLVEIVAPGTEDVTARWVIATRHQFRRHSNLNHCHACWRWDEENMYNWPHDSRGATLLPDVLAIGHNHVAATEHRTYERGTVIACRMGSWQYTSGFTRAKGFTLMPPTAPTVILPNVRDGNAQPHAYEDYRAALHALTTFAPAKRAIAAPSKRQREKQHRGATAASFIRRNANGPA